MTIQNNGTRDQYTATGGQTIFPYTFEIFAEGDLTVEQNGSIITAYTVSGVGNDSGGNVTLITGATAGDIITIYRDMAFERLNDYQNAGDFLASEVNDDYDRIWAALQQLETNTQAAIRPSPSDSILNSSNTELAAPSVRANKALGFTTAGELDYLSQVSAVVGTLREYSTLTAAISDIANISIGDVIITAERTTGNNGGATWDAVDESTVIENERNIVTGNASISFVLREKQNWDLIAQYGGIPGNDISAILNDIMANYGGILIDNGLWNAKDITYSSNFYLGFRSRSAVLRGVTASDDIFVSSGAVTSVFVTGSGRFDQCGNAFVHTGNSALASSVFEDVLFTNCTAGFDLSSAVGVTFRNLQFGVGSGADNIDYGIRFRKTGTGQTNENNFFDNRYANYAVAGVSYDDSAVVAGGNSHFGDWWEDSDHPGIFIGGNVDGLNLFGGYFETTGSATESDIEINPTTGSSVSINLYGVRFLTANSVQTSRIRLQGNSEVKTVDCSVTNPSGTVFVELDNSAAFYSELFSTRLNSVGGGTYESRLFSVTGSQTPSWDTHVGSGFVTNDDQPLRVLAGADAREVVTFTSGDATPSIRAGNYFKTAGTTAITNFDDGRVGQEIVVRAGNNITITNNANIKLNGAVNFAMTLDDTLTLFQFDSGVWTETARSVN